MKVSVEFLFHYRCDRCQKWWSVVDIYPEGFIGIPCPHCTQMNAIEQIEHPVAEGLSPAQYNNLGAFLANVGESLQKKARER